LDPNLISNYQVGSGPCLHIKFLGAFRGMGGTGQKMSRLFSQFSHFTCI
jgi:hypothetical protein